MIYKNTHEAGRSMIEMLGVLAIIGVLSVGGIAGYSQAMSKFKVSKTTDQVQAMVTNIRTLFAGQRTYAGLSSENAYTMGIFTDEICDDADCANAVNPYGGAITLSTPNTNKYFAITYDGLSQDACTRLVMADWGDSSSGLVGIIASGTVAPTTGLDTPESNPANGIFTTAAKDIPVTLPNAVAACKRGTDDDNAASIVWIYR